MSDQASRRVPVLDAAVNGLDRVLRVLLTVAFGAILVVTLVQIAGRNGLLSTMTGADEIARYLMVVTTFLAIPVLTKGRLHIAVDALSHYLPAGVPQVWLHRVIFAIEGAFYLFFANFAVLVVGNYQRTGQTSAELSIPLSWPMLAIVTGAVLGGLVSLALLVRTFLRAEEYADKSRQGFPGAERTDG
ncbi:TRAP transporter small permease [Aeromicrobium phragmitis]|uniref:TRAP transporter small permease n=1 Tax=Aeromicrobium phragmitis TaxID=2478914 RepID=UPI001409D0E3|nr:TRAP transporter small permease [Aeromicrobium phragmitis]